MFSIWNIIISNLIYTNWSTCPGGLAGYIVNQIYNCDYKRRKLRQSHITIFKYIFIYIACVLTNSIDVTSLNYEQVYNIIKYY